MRTAIFFLLPLLSTQSMAQSPVIGQYMFSRQEMVAGFNFLAGGKFEFFFSYGGADRTATGTFTVKRDVLTIKSDKEAGKDFTIKNQSAGAKGYSLKFEDANKFLVANIRCIFFIGEKKYEEFTDDNGEVQVEFPHVDKIYVQHALFPDVVTLVKDEHNENNRFVLTLNPSLGQVSLEGITFKIADNKTITCAPNYFMMMEDIKFKKQ